MEDTLNGRIYLRLCDLIGDTEKSLPAIIPVSKSTLWNWIAEGKFPAPKKLGPRTFVWLVSDIKNVLEQINAGKFSW